MIFDTPPAVEQCAAPSQDVILRVSGKPDQVILFMRDVAPAGSAWRIVEDKPSAAFRSLMLRARATVPYETVMDATLNANARLMTSRVTFAASGCSTS
jgi:hypothetical protein